MKKTTHSEEERSKLQELNRGKGKPVRRRSPVRTQDRLIGKKRRQPGGIKEGQNVHLLPRKHSIAHQNKTEEREEGAIPRRRKN